MKFCQNCVAELNPEAKFCAACGTPIAFSPPPPVQPSPQQQTYYQPQEPVYEQAREASNAFTEAISGNTNLVQRVINILTKPKEEWLVIACEQSNTMKLIGGYALILALVPALSAFIGFGVIGSYSLFDGVLQGITKLLSAVIGVYLLAWVIDMLAPSFYSQKNFGRSLQLAVYASTPQWVAGILMLFSTSISMLIMLFGLYAIYLLAVGMPIIKGTPKDKVVGYVALTIIAMIVISVVMALVLAAILGLFFAGSLGRLGL